MSILDRIERKINNMSTMLTRFGIDPAQFATLRLGTVFTTSTRACQTCPNGDMCRAWLHSAGRRIDRIPEFCPNARRFELAKADLSERATVN